MGNFQKIKYGGFLLAIFFCIRILLIIPDFKFSFKTIYILNLISYIIGFLGALFIYSVNMIDDLTGSVRNKALIAQRIGRQQTKRLILILLGVIFIIITVYLLYHFFT